MTWVIRALITYAILAAILIVSTITLDACNVPVPDWLQ